MNTIDETKITNYRLWWLMRDKGFSDCRTLARNLVDKGFYTSFNCLGNKSADYGSVEAEQYRNNINSLARSITRCLYNNQFQNDNLLIACCRFFNCSADYLLGLIDLPTHAKTDFNKLTGLWDNCIDTLSECNKHKSFDNSFAEYNQNIVLLLNYLLYQGKDRLVNHNKITFLNDVFNYLVFSDFDSYTDNDGIPQGSHITFSNKNGMNLCTLPVSNMYNAIKLNINSVLDTLRKHMKESGFFIIEKPKLENLLDEIKENQDKINEYDTELDEILTSGNPQKRKEYIGTLERCKGMCFERIHKLENDILSNHKDMLQKKDFSGFLEWQQVLFERLYTENEYYITDKI